MSIPFQHAFGGLAERFSDIHVQYTAPVRWRVWFIDRPAAFVSWWFMFYWTILSLFGFALLLMAMASLVLWWFGIRWGW